MSVLADLAIFLRSINVQIRINESAFSVSNTSLIGLLQYVGFFPKYVVENITNFFKPTGAFLDFYIASLISGSILGMNRKLLVKAAARYFPAIFGAVIVSFAFAAIIGVVTGFDLVKTILLIALPIMGGGMGAEAVPLSKIFESTGTMSAAEAISIMTPAVAIGNAVSIVLGGIVVKLLTSKYMNGQGQLISKGVDPKELEISPEMQAKRDKIDIKNLGIGLFASVSFFAFGFKKVVIFLDHYAPASTIRQAENQKQFRQFAKGQGIKGLMDVEQGVCHQILADKGYSAPGRLMVVTDSHTTTHGAFGAFSTGVGATDIACILKTGQLWFRVPEIIKINLEGELPAGVYAKDVILRVIGELGADYAIYRGVEFAGSLIPRLSIAERMTICNMTTEMGAKAAYIQPDSITIAFLKEKNITDYTIYETDSDFVYYSEHTFDVSEMTPQIAAPFSVDNVYDIKEYLGTPIKNIS
ncbi:MAG: aconitase family protein [Acetivibrionales bacterium]